MFYQPLEVPIQGVWTIVVELKTVTPVAAVAAALAGNGGPVRRSCVFGSMFSALLLWLDLVSFEGPCLHLA